MSTFLAAVVASAALSVAWVIKILRKPMATGMIREKQATEPCAAWTYSIDVLPGWSAHADDE